MEQENRGASRLFGLLGSKATEDDIHSQPEVNLQNANVSVVAPPSETSAEIDNGGTREDTTIEDEVVEMIDLSDIGVESDPLPQKFVIPAEDDDDLLNESELDMDAGMGLRIRKPTRTEFFKMNPASVFSASMLIYKSNPDAMDEQTYWVVKELRGKVVNELRKVRYFPCYSCSSKRLFILPVKISDSDWFRSLEVLFRQPPEFFETHAIRIKAEKELGRYRILHREDVDPVSWPKKSTAELVTDALGSANIISSADHAVYQELVSGLELK